MNFPLLRPVQGMLSCFVAGQDPRGVFVICNGRVKLSTRSSKGKSILVRVAEAGEMVGLPGCISGKPYELTAEALEPVQANFIPREAFLQFLRRRGEVAVRIADILSQIYQATLSEVRYVPLSASTTEKLARFLLDLPVNPAHGEERIRATVVATHKEISEMIGASRRNRHEVVRQFQAQAAGRSSRFDLRCWEQSRPGKVARGLTVFSFRSGNGEHPFVTDIQTAMQRTLEITCPPDAFF